jgi:hypothetical protein
MSLQPGSNPTPIDHELMSIDKLDKRVHCARYTNCLDHAVKREWASWSCSRCGVSEFLTYEQQREDLVGISKLAEELTPVKLNNPWFWRERHWRMK